MIWELLMMKKQTIHNFNKEGKGSNGTLAEGKAVKGRVLLIFFFLSFK